MSLRQFQSISRCVYPNQLFEFVHSVCLCVNTVLLNIAKSTRVLQSVVFLQIKTQKLGTTWGYSIKLYM